MAKYITYEIHNAEPIKAASTIMQSDSEYTKAFIPGAALRGAFISNYIKQYKVDDLNSGIHKERLLKDRMRFYNAYPYGDARSYPMISGYYALKDDIKKFGESGSMKITRDTSEFKDKQYDDIKSMDFCIPDIESGLLTRAAVEKENNMHIAKGSKNGDTKLFRYESLSKGQCFYGIICCRCDDDAAIAEETLKKGTFYIGGSKGSGYGLCKIEKVRKCDINPIINDFFEDEDSVEDEFDEADSIYVYALSDIIYRGCSNKYESFIDAGYIKEKLGLEDALLKESSVECESVTSFNSKWGYRSPMINAIKKGSIFKYDIKGEISKERILNLIDEGIGERRNEGYGEIMLLPELPFIRISSGKQKDGNIKFNMNMDAEEKEQFQFILDRLYENKLKNNFYKKVLLESSKLKPYEKRIKRSQWGKLMSLMCNLEGKDYDDGMELLKEYFKHISDKKNNTELKNALNSIKIDNNVLKDYIINFIAKKDKAHSEAENGSAIRIKTASSNVTEEEIYRYRVRILKEAFRLQIKEDR